MTPVTTLADDSFCIPPLRDRLANGEKRALKMAPGMAPQNRKTLIFCLKLSNTDVLPQNIKH
jgi:hypothetical protein